MSPGLAPVAAAFPAPFRPGFAPRRLAGLARALVMRTRLDLSGLVVLTEAATGAYGVTPALAGLAGAERVYALARSSRHGSAAEAALWTQAVAAAAGVGSRVEVVGALDPRWLGGVDLVTNSGHLRPISASFVAALPPRAVVALMYEAWEFRAADVDLAACRARGVPVVGVDERHPALDVFSFLGPLCVRMLHEAGVAVYMSRIALLCDNDFGPSVERGLAGLGASVRVFARAEEVPDGPWDAVVAALRPGDRPRIDGAAAAHLARVAPGVVAQLWGDLDREALARGGVPVWPPAAPAPGHMGGLLSEIGPEAVVRLQAGGLKAAEAVIRDDPDAIAAFAQLL